jgi:hypothetical protein
MKLGLAHRVYKQLTEDDLAELFVIFALAAAYTLLYLNV